MYDLDCHQIHWMTDVEALGENIRWRRLHTKVGVKVKTDHLLLYRTASRHGASFIIELA